MSITQRRTMTVRIRSLVLACLLVLIQPASLAWSQQATPTIATLEAQIAEWQRASTAMGAQLQALQAERDSGYLDAIRSYHASLVDHYAYQAELRDQARSVLGWQLFSAYVLLGLVALVVILGVALSFLEVRSGLVSSRLVPALSKAVADAVPDPPPDPVLDPALEPAEPAPAAPAVVDHRHSITLSATSLQVTSAITGVIILVISLGFLYLFVDKVLELKPVDLVTQNQPSDLPAAETAKAADTAAPAQ